METIEKKPADPDLSICGDCLQALPSAKVFTKLEFKDDEPVFLRLCGPCLNKREGLPPRNRCEDCGGTGVDPSDNNAEHDRECPKCDGTGTVRPCELCDGQGKLDAGGGSEVWCHRCCGTGAWMTEQEAQERTEAIRKQ